MWIKPNSSRFAKGAPNTMEFFWARLDQLALNASIEQEAEEMGFDPGAWGYESRWDTLSAKERISTRWAFAQSQVSTLLESASYRGIAEVWY